MTARRKFVLGVLLLTLLAHSRPASAQFTSAIEGTVFDPSGLATQARP
jgi:hypothetical protein